MEGQKYCVYNQTRESFLSLGVTVTDEGPGLVKEWVERQGVKTDSGLWLKPYRGVPSLRRYSAVDLVYLDTEFRVIQELESFPNSNEKPTKAEAASALVLPAHTIYSSQTQPGDQLVICVAQEMEQQLEGLSSAGTASTKIRTDVSSKQQGPGATVPQLSHLQGLPKNVHSTFQGSDEMKNFEPKTGRPNSLKTWLQNWLSSDRRRSLRQPLPGLVAYYWTGSTPRAYQISDISSSGFYVLTEERWFPGTLVLMTLQRTDSLGKNLEDSISVQTKVVRWGSDGLGLAFVLARSADPGDLYGARENGADRKTLERFLDRLSQPSEDLHLIPR
ncbi:MAG TPA: PilZ domain-containing protein [Terracidiphilus sp.]|nr:PilZ domain-containing protein [Terracidiphilus sp.]